MPSTHVNAQYHLVFSTKDRTPSIKRDWRPALHRFLGGALRHIGCVPLEIGGTTDHVHLLAALKATHSLSQVLQEIKTASSRWVHEELDERKFAWQEGYGAFSVGRRELPSIRSYIVNQEAHHARRSFQDEYRALLERYEIAFDERYLW